MNKLINLYKADVWKRVLIFFIVFQVLLWIFFGISYYFNRDAWINVKIIEETVNYKWWSLLIFIIFNNSIICFLIAFGNLFARFKFLTPGVLVMLIQIISIGWLAGSNDFEVPFVSVAAANIQFVKVGLWEITAYILTFSVTISKSLNESNEFLPKKWDKVTKIKELKFNRSEVVILALAFILIVLAAIIETILLT